MPLEALPVELFCVIFRHVGSKELQKQGARCLLVCKWWYAVAEPILYEDLVLSANHFLQMPDSAAKKLVQYARHVQIYTDLRLDWPSDNPEYLLGERLKMLLSPGHGASAPAPAQLESFTLRTHTPYDGARLLNPRHRCLPKWSPVALVDSLAVSNLEHLVLDTRDSRFKGGMHVCPCLARKIPSLRSLRLRMRRICPRVFNILWTGTGTGTGMGTSRIESIIINISLVEPGHTYGRFSRHCTKVMSTYGLFNEMIRVASETVKQTPSLRQMRILRHKNPTISVLAHDCVTGNRTVLLGDRQWDWGDHGKPFNSEIHEIICDRETASISSMDEFVDHDSD